MALIRILVDGYSLLHAWPALAPGQPRYSQAAREELLHQLRLYRDATSIPITVFFDGSSGSRGTKGATKNSDVEVLFSRSGQTADQLIERAAHRFATYGEVLAVTNDVAERETVLSLGGMACSCRNFIEMVMRTLMEQADDIKHINRRERHAFGRRRSAS